MMKKRAFLGSMGAGLVAGVSLGALSKREVMAEDASAAGHELRAGEIQHMVIFNLKHEKDSREALRFLRDGRRILKGIPVVKGFQVFRQVSGKNDYDYGFSMVFSGKADYEAYNEHPDHVAFVEERWKKEVSRFLEIDFEAKAV